MITPQLIAEAGALLAGHGAGESGVAMVKQRFAGVRFTLCSDDDVPLNAVPVADGDDFNLYLVGGSQHCLALTNDYDIAVAVLIAQVG